MKNKHLVLLFLSALVTGLLLRQAPWEATAFFQTRLLKIDTSSVLQLHIRLPERPPLTFYRSDAGWLLELDDRTYAVEPAPVNEMVAQLANMQSIRIIKDMPQDSLGLAAKQAIEISVTDRQGHSEVFLLGKETLEADKPASYVLLPRHAGIYVVGGHLRRMFAREATEFRNRQCCNFDPLSVRAICISGGKRDSVFLMKSDTGAFWQQLLPGVRNAASDTVMWWLNDVSKLKNLPFAEHIDDTQAPIAHILLEFSAQEPLMLSLQPVGAGELAVRSSQNPENYFSLNDTAWVRKILEAFK